MASFRALLALSAPLFLTQPAASQAFSWSSWSQDLFGRAKAEKRLVLLDLEAVWCHWCHVMEAVTYGDPKVAALIGDHFVAIRADQDASPELSSRYGDWGWPATIILAADGTELAKLRGFIEPDKLAALLKAFVDDPTPGPSAFSIEDVAPAPEGLLGAPARAAMKKAVDQSFDSAHGGWGRGHRYIDADSLDLAMVQAETGDGDAAARARKTLDAARALIDPVWGGVYQYSDKDDWSSPHFEKLMAFQGQYLRQYSEAFSRWRDPADLAAAMAIKAYMATVLRDPQGGFYVSQDADLDARTDGHAFYALDDSGRRRLGVPRIDKAIYASANGAAISGLAAFFDAAGDRQALDMAVDAAQWIKAHRAIEGGGFSHSEHESDGPFLADNLAMGQAFIDLYAATGERSWLRDAAATGRFIAAHFREQSGGFAPAAAGAVPVGALSRPIRQLDDQIAVARFMNRLNRYTGDKDFAALADHAMRYAIASARETERPLPGLLLADHELSHAPTHITVVGPKDDDRARELGAQARAFPALYKRLDWWDTREGPLPNPDITYPEMDQPAAFACGDRICSLPAFTAAQLKSAVERMARLGQSPNAPAVR